MILAFYDKSEQALKKGAVIDNLVNMPSRERIGRFKYTKEEECAKAFEEILSELDSDVEKAVSLGDE